MNCVHRWPAICWFAISVSVLCVSPHRCLLGDVTTPGSARNENPLHSPKSQPAGPSRDSIAQWLAGLDDDRYAVRAEATRRLIEGGMAVVEPLLQIASNGNPESITRALTVLESLYATNGGQPAEIVDSVERGLERLAESANPSAALRAAEILEQQSAQREIRAIANIRRLGGIVRLANDGEDRKGFNPGKIPAGLRRIEAVIIPAGWKGGDDGLRYVKRLERLPVLFRVPGNQVSDKGMRELQAALPNLAIQQRGPANLGIRLIPDPQNGNVWRVSDVDKNSAAERAGIQLDDVISKFGGKDVPNFDALIALIMKTKPGDAVDVVVKRGKDFTPLKVVMQEWKNLDE